MAKRRAKGEGSIFKENTGYWCAEITMPDGKKKRKRSKKQHIVRKWLHDQQSAIQTNLLLKDERMTVAKYLDHFIDNVAAHTLARSTIRSYKYLIRDHIKPEIGQIKLVNLRPNHLQDLYSAKLNAGLSPRTVQYIHSVIRLSLNQALKSGLLYRNPTDGVTPPRPRRQVPKTLSAEQAKLFLVSINDHRWYPIYVLALMTGMRKGEILGLHWEDIDLEKGTANIKHTLVTVQGKSFLSQPKSDNARRAITLSNTVIKVLKQQQLYSKNEGLVFTTSTVRPVSQRNLTRHFHLALAKLGIQRIRFHDLRHTAATLLLKANVHPKIVQDMLGHSSVVLTLDTYSHVIPGMQDEAAEEMDRIFS